MSLANWAAGFCAASLTCHGFTIAAAARRLRRSSAEAQPRRGAPPVTVLRPVCGIDNFAEETLASTFRLDYPEYEIIFCVAQPDDPVLPLVRELVQIHPEITARLLVGDDRISS